MNNNIDFKNESYKDYMDRISSETIPAYEPELGNEELILLEDVIKSNWISEGKYVRKFEELLRITCEREYALAFNNCTAALITGMKSMGIGEGDDVIVQSMVHSADPNSIAATAGMKAGDVVLEINGEKIADAKDMAGIIRGAKLGNMIRFLLQRKGEEEPLVVEALFDN